MRKADRRTEAKLIQIACGSAPDGHSRWTLKLLEEKSHVELEAPTGRESIHRMLKKVNSTSTETTTGVSCQKFVVYMEDVLDIYGMPYDPTAPVVYMNEKPYQLLDKAREPLPPHPGDT